MALLFNFLIVYYIIGLGGLIIVGNIKSDINFLSKLIVFTKKDEKYNNLNIKITLLSKIKKVLCDKFKINPKDIQYEISSLASSVAICDKTIDNSKANYTVKIDRDYLTSVPYGSLIVTVLHEWGHIRQSVCEERGGRKLEDVDIDEAKLILMDNWQKLGFNMRYAASDDEFFASVYALKQAKEWLEQGEYNGKNQKLVDNKKARIDRIYKRLCRSYCAHKIGYRLWKNISELFNIEEESSCFQECLENETAEEHLYNINKAMIEDMGKKDKALLQKELIYLEHKLNKRTKKSVLTNARENDEKLYLTSIHLRLLAIKNGLNQEDYAISLGIYNDLFSFKEVEPTEKCPLAGILNISVRNMNMLTGKEYVKLLKQEVRKINSNINQSFK